tara:strand:- start:2234 stop:2461 length:228 start_codon:yes stop_codon:yes gene_type:complete
MIRSDANDFSMLSVSLEQDVFQVADVYVIYFPQICEGGREWTGEEGQPVEKSGMYDRSGDPETQSNERTSRPAKI